VFTVEPQSMHYRNWGIKEVKGLPIPDWVDKVNIDLATNHRKRGWHKKAYRLASGLSVTTERLAETVRQYNKNVAVLPNCVETGMVNNYIQARSEDVRICYQGDVSHIDDIGLLTKPLEKVLSKYNRTSLVVCGNLCDTVRENLKGIERIYLEQHPEFVPVQAHFYRMMWLQIDMGVIPLIDTEFNQCKSSLKYYEFAAMGVPCVVSRVPPYTDDIPEDAVVFVENTDEAWAEGLSRLATNADLRKRIGDNARDWVVANRDSVKNAHLWWDFYNGLYEAGRKRQSLCA
jgi:glycosyltransferase involved in cell wall biosynthesis